MKRAKDSDCERCGKQKRSDHFNTKYCEPCRRFFLSKPKSNLSAEQIEIAEGFIGKMPREEICERLGCSLINLKRAFRGRRLAYHNHLVRQPELVKRVCAYYEKHGKKKTIQRFPELRIRSIVERYKLFKPRQVRWTNAQLIEAARMSGLVSMANQAKFFNRPNANEGAIKSLWTKRYGFGGGSLHGMSHWTGRHLVHARCKPITTRFWNTRRGSKEFSRKLYLWVDMERHLRPDLPLFIKDAIQSMAHFQRWLFSSDSPRSAILRLIRERDYE